MSHHFFDCKVSEDIPPRPLSQSPSTFPIPFLSVFTRTRFFFSTNLIPVVIRLMVQWWVLFAWHTPASPPIFYAVIASMSWDFVFLACKIWNPLFMFDRYPRPPFLEFVLFLLRLTFSPLALLGDFSAFLRFGCANGSCSLPIATLDVDPPLLSQMASQGDGFGLPKDQGGWCRYI